MNLLKTSPTADVRERAAFALMLFGDRAASAVPELIAALDDQEESVRDAAIGALTGLRGRAVKAIPALVARLGDERLNGGGFDKLRYPIFKALAAIGEPAVLDLSRALGSNDKEVRWCAAEALRLIGPEARAATEALAKHLDDPDEPVAFTCLKAIQAIGPEARAAIPTLSALLKETDMRLVEDESSKLRFKTLVSALASLGAEPDPILIRDLESNRPLSCLTALSSLAEYGPRARSQASRVERLLADPDDEDIRWQAAVTLSRIDPPGTVAINRSVAALSSPDPKLRLEAANTLLQVGPSARGAIPALTRALKDPDRDVREAVALAIAEIDPTVPAAVAILTEAFRRSSKGESSIEEFHAYLTSRALGDFGPLAREAIPVLSDHLKGPHLFNSTDSTLEALIRIDPSGEGVAHALAGALGTADEESRLLFLRTLANLGTRASFELPEVVKMLKDANDEIRQEAAQTLGRMGPAAMTAVPDLMNLLRDDEPSVRSAAIEALGEVGMGVRDVAPGLIEMIRREADLENLRTVIALIQLDPSFKATAVRLAQESDDFYFRAAIEGALGHETFEAQALIRLEIRDLDPALETKRGSDRDSDVSHQIEQTLDYLNNFGAGARSALPWIERATKNPDPRIRRAANFSIEQIRKSAPKD